MTTRKPPGRVECPTCGALAGQRCTTMRTAAPLDSRAGLEFKPRETGYHAARVKLAAAMAETTEGQAAILGDRWADFTKALTGLTDSTEDHPGAWTATGLISFGVIIVGLIGLMVDDGTSTAWVLVMMAGCLLSLSWLVAGVLMDRWQL